MPGEEPCTNVDSEDDNKSTSQKKSKKCSKNWRDKAVMIVEGSGTPIIGKKAKAEAPASKLPRALTARKPLPLRKPGREMDRTARFIGPRATACKSVTKLSSLSRNREQNMRSVIRKKVRMALVGRPEAVKQIAQASPFKTKENLPGAERRKFAMMRVMEGMKRKLVSRSSRRPQTPCALAGVHLCTPLTASLNGGRVRSMSWSQRQSLGSRSNGHACPSSLTMRTIPTALSW